MSRWITFRSLASLGPSAVARVAVYRLGLRLGWHPVQHIVADVPRGLFFAASPQRDDLPPANAQWSTHLRWFDWFSVERTDGPPDWHFNPFGDARGGRSSPWWEIPDFVGSGDIKGVWELSRFGWLVAFATQAANGDSRALADINTWLASWWRENPPYRGVNWKCGQEASIRVMHLLAAAMILGQSRAPQTALVETIVIHLKRIAPTMSYAIGQNNNHGTSEAAAMFVGGSFLTALGRPEGGRWAETGRRWLENRARRLIAKDGSFSQYSVAYHRLMLDTYVFAEIWRRRLGLAPFSKTTRSRLAVATRWLDAMTDRHTGDVPTLGANDGARILPLTEADYRDFRPSLQAASILFRNERALADAGPWDDQLRWFGIEPVRETAPPPGNEVFDDGGFLVLRTGAAVGYLRYPRFRFRPSQADLLHFDLWVEGRNVLRDGGTFSYNAPPKTSEYFAGIASHNSVQFDGRDPMPRLGRFLFGAWPKAYDVEFGNENDAVRGGASYTDYRGERHHREITLRSNGFVCTDTISGRFDFAVLRWRLAPDDYRLADNCLSGPAGLRLTICCETAECGIDMTTGYESRYYLQQQKIPVLEIAVRQPCRIVTVGEF